VAESETARSSQPSVSADGAARSRNRNRMQ
jgi:hypothetical protein